MSEPRLIYIDQKLYGQAEAAASVEHRSVSDQIEFWARVGRMALDNPDLPASFIAGTLIALSDPQEEAEPFVPGTRNK